MWKTEYSALMCNHGLALIATMVIPIVVAVIYYKDKITQMPVIMFSQPIKGNSYALGKFLGAYIYTLYFALIANIIWILIPIYFGEIPYSPITFLKWFLIYSIPSFLAITAFSYFIEVLFNIKLVTIMLSMFLLQSVIGQPNIKYSVVMFIDYANNLKIGIPLTFKVINEIMINRIYVLVLAVIFIILSVLKFSPQKLMNRR